MFFFEKKNQKTFAPLRACVAPASPGYGAVVIYSCAYLGFGNAKACPGKIKLGS
jgi:hypothetical protein